ncbi:MAG TPA: SurA N-terminal domain-containing protein [Gemmatimonadaceae bacterium]|nr:SurA N-terminal domain-containing protein [Gemmatimonadaceae bacterium]
MLKTMRSWAKFIWIFVIAAPFIFGFLFYQMSGIGGAGAVTPSTPVAKVDGQEILYKDFTQAVQNQIASQQQQSGATLTQDETQQIRNSVFDQMVMQILLDKAYARRGITVSDDEIRQYAEQAPPQWVQSSPDLQTDGKFDYAKYQRFLSSAAARQSGLLVQLENFYRTEIPRQKLFAQVTAGVYVSDATLWRDYQDAHDSAQVSFVAWNNVPDSADFRSVTDAQRHEYYDAHHAEFTRPSTARISLVELRRVISAADTAAVRNHLLELRQEITSGKATFATIAKAESTDSASAVNGGELGMSARGRFVPAFDKAAWALRPGQISEPVLTPFGFHLIKLNSRKGDSVDVSHILLPIKQSDSSATRVDRKADSLATIAANAFDQPAKLDTAAERLHLTVYKLTVTENQPATLNGQPVPSASAWAFGGARQGDISDLFDDDNGYYLARLDSLIPGGLRSFDEVKDQVNAEVAAQHHLDRMMPAATALAKAAAGSSLESAARQAGLPVHTSNGWFSRTSFVPGLGGQYTAAIGAAFGLPLHAVSNPVRDQAQITVERVDRRVTADSVAWLKQKDAQRRQRISQLQQASIQMYLQGLHDEAKIDDRRKQIDAAIRRTNG